MELVALSGCLNIWLWEAVIEPDAEDVRIVVLDPGQDLFEVAGLQPHIVTNIVQSHLRVKPFSCKHLQQTVKV